MTFPFFPFFHAPSLVDIAIDHFSEAESQQIHLHLPKTELQLSVACGMHKISACRCLTHAEITLVYIAAT